MSGLLLLGRLVSDCCRLPAPSAHRHISGYISAFCPYCFAFSIFFRIFFNTLSGTTYDVACRMPPTLTALTLQSSQPEVRRPFLAQPLVRAYAFFAITRRMGSRAERRNPRLGTCMLCLWRSALLPVTKGGRACMSIYFSGTAIPAHEGRKRLRGATGG